MKTILCYGDSNTYGWDPRTGGRYDHKTRWPMVLKRLLNQGRAAEDPAWWVVEEGLNGRTSCRDDPVEGYKNGLRQLLPVLESHFPLDVVALMLGTNDLKHRYSPNPYDIARGVNAVVTAIKDSHMGPAGGAPRVIVICPPPVLLRPAFEEMFGPECEAISRRLYPFFAQYAQESGATLIDAGKVIKSSEVDGIHLDPAEHLKLAEVVASCLM